MEIREERAGKIVIVDLKGRLDSTTSADFEKKLAAWFDDGEKQLLADLSQLEYISSAGLRAFLVGAKRASKEDGKLMLCGLQSQVKEVFDIAGFSPLFPIYESREAALRASRK